MVIVLTKKNWNALMKILDQVNTRTLGSSECAILVHPVAAAAFKRRTGRDINEGDGKIDYTFDPADYSLDLITPERMKFAKKGSEDPHDAAASSLEAILKSVGRGPDGVTEIAS